MGNLVFRFLVQLEIKMRTMMSKHTFSKISGIFRQVYPLQPTFGGQQTDTIQYSNQKLINDSQVITSGAKISYYYMPLVISLKAYQISPESFFLQKSTENDFYLNNHRESCHVCTKSKLRGRFNPFGNKLIISRNTSGFQRC